MTTIDQVCNPEGKMLMLRSTQKLAGIFVATAVAAIDCLAIRSACGQSTVASSLLMISLLPMSNIIAFLLLNILISAKKINYYWTGFFLSGVFAIIAFSCFWYSSPRWLAVPVDNLDEYFYNEFLLGGNTQLRHYPYQFDSALSYARFAGYLALVAAAPTSVMMNLALIGGLSLDRLARTKAGVHPAGGAASKNLGNRGTPIPGNIEKPA